MIDQAKTQEMRKPYRKPEIQRVQLVPGDAVLGGCKTVSSGGGIGLGTSGDCVDKTPQCVTTYGS